jgi:outer membrane protein W
MQTKNTKALALVLLSAALTSQAQAQSDEQVLNSAPIDVDGYVQERSVTDNELEQIKGEIRKQKTEVKLNKEKTKGFKELTKTTEKLSETTEEYIDEKKTAQKEISEYNKKIKCLMEENPGKDCEKYVRNKAAQNPSEVEQQVSVQQAAAASSTTSVAPKVLTGAPFEVIKLLGFAGGTQFNGNVEQLEAEISTGIRLESNITTRFTMGLGFNYTTLKTEDFANNIYSSQVFGQGYQGREIQYRSMGLDLYGKFFLTQSERFRPYVGAALGYNRANLKYSDNDPYQTAFGGNMFNFGDENYRTSFATGTVMLGSEVMITPGFGLNIEGAFSTGLGESLSSQSSKNISFNPDQGRLRDLGEEIINANALSIFVGAVVLF